MIQVQSRPVTTWIACNGPRDMRRMNLRYTARKSAFFEIRLYDTQFIKMHVFSNKIEQDQSNQTMKCKFHKMLATFQFNHSSSWWIEVT